MEVRAGAVPGPAAPSGWRWRLCLAPVFLVLFMDEIFWAALEIEPHQWGWTLYFLAAATVNGWVFRYLLRTALAAWRAGR